MKKFLRYIVHNRKTIIKTILIGITAIVAYELAHKLGTADRGYEAIGGEIFIPFLVIFAKPLWEMIKEPFKTIKNI